MRPTAAEIAAALRRTRAEWLPAVFPNGKVVNGNFHIGNADGASGDSLPIPLNSGKGEALADFAGGFTGDDLDLYARGRRLELPAAMAEAARLFGLGDQSAHHVTGGRPEQRKALTDAEKVETSRQLWRRAVADNDALDRYLTEVRGISQPVSGWPGTVRFHPGIPDGFHVGRHRPAMLMIKTDPAGNPCGLHAVFLRPGGAGKADLHKPKKSFGSGGVVVIRREGEVVLACEGPEDALSLAIAAPETAVICTAGAGTLYRLAEHLPIGTRRVVLVADRDDAGRIGAEKAARVVSGAGVPVAIACPPEGVKDANDLLRTQGIEALKIMLENAVPFVDGRQPRLRLVPFDQINVCTNSNTFVKGLLGCCAMSVVYGESGAGKTFWVLDLALHIALGREWCGRRVQQGGVVYIAAEGAAGISNRVAAFKRHHGITGQAPFAILPTSVNLLDPAADTGDLIELIKSATAGFGMPVALVVVDTLSRVLAGGNENAPEDMGALVMNADRIREATRAHVMFVHHSGKDGSKGARGHSLLRAATDTEIEVSRDPASKVCAARITKQKELPTDGTFAFTLEAIDLGRDEDGDSVTACVVAVADGVVAPVRNRQLASRPRFALEVLTDVLVREGFEAPAALDGHIPRGITVATEAAWREAFYARSVEGEKHDTISRAFRRAVEALQDAGRVAVWKDYVWLVN